MQLKKKQVIAPEQTPLGPVRCSPRGAARAERRCMISSGSTVFTTYCKWDRAEPIPAESMKTKDRLADACVRLIGDRGSREL
jgi:hypothetical protein